MAFPTETVYGLGADALNQSGVARVFALKARPATRALIVHVTGIEMARAIAGDWPESASRLADAFWPGPLSLIVPRSPAIPDIVSAGGATIAVRCPDHPMALDLIAAFGSPIVGPSANRSGQISPTTADHVRQQFDPKDVLVLDAGPCPGGLESTVLDLTADPPRLCRTGPIDARDIASILGCPVASGPTHAVRIPVSPPPEAGERGDRPLLLFDASDWPGVLDRLIGANRVAAIVTPEPDRAPPPHRLIRMPAEAHAYAARLYAALREADQEGVDMILVERPSAEMLRSDRSLWAAILDRLERLAGPSRGGGRDG